MYFSWMISQSDFIWKINTGRTVSTVAKSSGSCFGLWHSSYRCWGNRKWAWLCCRIGTWCSRCLFRNKVFSRPLVFLSADIWKQSLLFVVSIVLCSRYNGTWTFRFVATEESFAHPIYKKKLIEMSRTDYTNVFGRARWPDAPQRVLETPFYAGWKNNLSDHETEESQPIIGHCIIHGMVCIRILDLPWICSPILNLKVSIFHIFSSAFVMLGYAIYSNYLHTYSFRFKICVVWRILLAAFILTLTINI